MTEISIPESVVEIFGLGGAKYLTTVTIANDFAIMMQGCFAGCESLKTVKIPSTLKSIDNDFFIGCKSLQSFIIPSDVTYIGFCAFRDCTNLETILIPNKVNTIDDEAFANCLNLKEIVSLNTTPPSIEENTFINVSRTGCVVKVPSEAVSSYRAAEGWNEFTISEFEENGIIEVYNGNNTRISATDLTDAKNKATAENALIFASYVSIPSETNLVIDDAAQNIVLTDAKPFYCPADVIVENMNYKKNYAYNFWQPLYVPFSATCAQWGSDISIAYFNNIHQYDTNNDGTIDKITLEFFTMSGSDEVQANVPYLAKPTTTGSKSFIFNNVTMKATPSTDGYVSCASTTWDYKILGNYQPLTGLGSNYYVIGTGGAFLNLASSSTLSPFRIRLQTAPVSYGTRSVGGLDGNLTISIMVDGEEIDFNGENLPQDFVDSCFDLQGRKIDSQNAKGMVIRNGKVIYVK